MTNWCLSNKNSAATARARPGGAPQVASSAQTSGLIRGRLPEGGERGFVGGSMFVVVTATFRLLYTLIVLGHDRRKVIHFDVTQNPNQVWLARQMTEALPWDTTPRFLLRDRMLPTARPSVTVSRQWVLRRSLPRHDPRGRTPMWSASSARSAAISQSHHHLR